MVYGFKGWGINVNGAYDLEDWCILEFEGIKIEGFQWKGLMDLEDDKYGVYDFGSWCFMGLKVKGLMRMVVGGLEYWYILEIEV